MKYNVAIKTTYNTTIKFSSDVKDSKNLITMAGRNGVSCVVTDKNGKIVSEYKW